MNNLASRIMVAVIAVAALIALHEFYGMVRDLRPLVPAGFAGVLAALAAVHHGGVAWVAGPLVAMVVVAFWLSAVAEVRQPAVVQLAATVFGAVWIGLGFVFLVAVRDLPGEHGLGKELLLAVLIGVWASDIAAFTIGRLFGRRLSPIRDWQWHCHGRLGLHRGIGHLELGRWRLSQ